MLARTPQAGDYVIVRHVYGGLLRRNRAIITPLNEECRAFLNRCLYRGRRGITVGASASVLDIHADAVQVGLAAAGFTARDFPDVEIWHQRH